MGDFRRGNASFQVELGVFEAKMRDFHLKRDGEVRVKVRRSALLETYGEDL